MAIEWKNAMKLSRNPLNSAFAIALAVCASTWFAHADQTTPAKLPVTTSSKEAAQYFEAGMVDYENHKWNLAIDSWNQAIKADPNFAQPYVWISLTTGDPAEEARDRAKAKSLAKKVSPGEQLLIRWLVGVRENHYVQGIMAMNDMLAMFPHDKRLNFMAGYWLFRWQDEYEISKKFTLRALAEDPNYAPCYNQLGYVYSREGDIDKALESIAKYNTLLPNEPNPHDSYGEMLRFAGRYEDALEQYRLALKIDPTFYISQKELGETYSLMGNEAQARKEYQKAIALAPSSSAKAEYLQKLALTYVREKNYAEADIAYLDAAANALSLKQWIWEARAHRVMAMYEPNHSSAMRNLAQADALLSAAAGKVAQIDLQEEKAHILRVRVERLLDAGDDSDAQNLVAELEKMTSQGAGVNTERTYHGAAGTLLFVQKNYADAIPQLEEDLTNPLSMKLLITAYRETGDADEAGNLARKLRAWKVPSVEEALATSDSSNSKKVVAVK
jgi:tetratricopeptide (TPR) repeat protein